MLLAFIFLSCDVKPQPVVFPVRGGGYSGDYPADAGLLGLSKDAVNGTVNFSRPVKLEYRFSDESAYFHAGMPMSLEIEYSVNVPVDESFRFFLSAGGSQWVLPVSAGAVFHYAVPVENIFSQQFSVELAAGERRHLPPAAHFRIHSVELVKRWYGYDHVRNEGANHFYTSPFLSRRSDSWVLDIPGDFDAPSGFYPGLTVMLQPGEHASAEAGPFLFEAQPFSGRISIPAGLIAPNASISLAGDRTASFRLAYAKQPVFPAPVTADPGLILAWPQELWRNARYEVFRWEQFPSLLIFDFADYAVQDRMLKRLAFFVEKAGYRGRLASDAEIAALHGWNAHDYRAEDIAHFFRIARQENFPLLAEEAELERILLDNGIIKNSGGAIQAGEGGIISIARESPHYLRIRFMAHEGFHGIFFIDEDFRSFSRLRWRNFNPDAKRFLTSYFDYQHYDTADEYLLVNEFMAHILQQPVSQAAGYFGETLPARIESIPWRAASLPEKHESSGTWPLLASIFSAEAKKFSAYVEKRWGLAAGRISLITARQK